MPLWRCPHCSTPQAEAARCWVCRRSTTSCGTCRHFRRAVASGLGTCGLDPRRVALTGAEMRACWAAPDPVPDDGPSRGAALPVVTIRGSADEIAGRRPRTFVPVDELQAPATRGGAAVPAIATTGRGAVAGGGSATRGGSATGGQGAGGGQGAAGGQGGAGGRGSLGWSLWGDLDP